MLGPNYLYDLRFDIEVDWGKNNQQKRKQGKVFSCNHDLDSTTSGCLGIVEAEDRPQGKDHPWASATKRSAGQEAAKHAEVIYIFTFTKIYLEI